MPDLYVLSARYGLISGSHLIPDYDVRLTQERIMALRPTVSSQLDALWETYAVCDLCICITHDYAQLFIDWEAVSSEQRTLIWIEGKPGRKLSLLHDWLYQGCAVDHRQLTGRAIRLRGVDLDLTAEQVVAIARQKLQQGDTRASAVQTWCVWIDGQPVAAKWLVSQLTGLPVSAFGGSEARRVLEQLGVQVTRA